MKKNAILIFTFFAFASFLTTTSLSAKADAAPAPAKKVIYLFAHEDDEIFILAKMATDLGNGCDVHAVWVTDGSGTADPAIREKESRAAMKMVGLPESNLHFLGYQDRYSYKHLDAVLADVLKIAGDDTAEITTDAYEGGNIDHDVTNIIGEIVAQRIKSKPVHYEFPLYNTYKHNYRAGLFLPRDDAKTLYTPLDEKLAALKMDALDVYKTQFAIINTIKAVTNKKKAMRDGEPYRVAPKYDYLKPPTDEILGYTVNKRFPLTFDDWLAQVKPFLEKVDAK